MKQCEIQLFTTIIVWVQGKLWTNYLRVQGQTSKINFETESLLASNLIEATLERNFHIPKHESMTWMVLENIYPKL